MVAIGRIKKLMFLKWIMRFKILYSLQLKKVSVSENLQEFSAKTYIYAVIISAIKKQSRFHLGWLIQQKKKRFHFYLDHPPG